MLCRVGLHKFHGQPGVYYNSKEPRYCFREQDWVNKPKPPKIPTYLKARYRR